MKTLTLPMHWLFIFYLFSPLAQAQDPSEPIAAEAGASKPQVLEFFSEPGQKPEENACLSSVREALQEVNPRGELHQPTASADIAPGSDSLGRMNIRRMRQQDFALHVQGVSRIGETIIMSGNARGGSYLYYGSPETGIQQMQISDELAHPGGIQAIGSILAVGMDNTHGKRSQGPSQIQFIDFRNPLEPVELRYLRLDRPNSPDGTQSLVSAVAVTRLTMGPHTGRYLVMAYSDRPYQIDYYLSSGTDLRNPSVRFEPMASVPAPPQNFQSVQILNQCDGSLFVLGSRGSNHLSVISQATGLAADTLTHNTFHLFELKPEDGWIMAPVDRKPIRCRHCTLNAGGGAFVDPESRVLHLYATPNWPNRKSDHSIMRYEEFTPREEKRSRIRLPSFRFPFGPR